MLHLLLLGWESHVVAIEGVKTRVWILYGVVGFPFELDGDARTKPVFLHNSTCEVFNFDGTRAFLKRIFLHQPLHLVLKPGKAEHLVEELRPPGTGTMTMFEGVATS